MNKNSLPAMILDRLDDMAASCARHRVRRLDLFGSALNERLTDSSDVDFLVEFEAMPHVEYATAYFGLLSDLETLFGRSVDLIEARAIKNPFFQQAVNETKRTLYAA